LQHYVLCKRSIDVCWLARQQTQERHKIMAFFIDTHSREAGLGARLASTVADMLNGVAKVMARRNVARTTFNELAALSNAELADMGIARCQIRRIALETARNAV
jgi:uncharacterized protein YjiS (DUF1127 family)